MNRLSGGPSWEFFDKREHYEQTAHASEHSQRALISQRRVKTGSRDSLTLIPTGSFSMTFPISRRASTKMARLRGRARRGQRCRAAIPHGHWKTTDLYGAALAPAGWTGRTNASSGSAQTFESHDALNQNNKLRVTLRDQAKDSNHGDGPMNGDRRFPRQSNKLVPELSQRKTSSSWTIFPRTRRTWGQTGDPGVGAQLLYRWPFLFGEVQSDRWMAFSKPKPCYCKAAARRTITEDGLCARLSPTA